jgi:hypothetical protein
MFYGSEHGSEPASSPATKLPAGEDGSRSRAKTLVMKQPICFLGTKGAAPTNHQAAHIWHFIRSNTQLVAAPLNHDEISSLLPCLVVLVTPPSYTCIRPISRLQQCCGTIPSIVFVSRKWDSRSFQ